jgi:endonuclease/exonuclease/phosphatase family metal-dependent hydrolase
MATKRSFLLLTFIFAVFFACSPKIKYTAIPAEPLKELRVLTYNIHHCNPPSKEGLIDLDTIARVIAKQNPDLVALQEVDVRTQRSGNINQAAELAAKLKMNVYFGKAIDHDGGEYGVAILSKYPLSDTITHKLPNDGSAQAEPRVAALATVTLPGNKKIRFGSTHLDAQKADASRLLQVAEINLLAGSENLPFIIAGDLNAHPATKVIRDFDEAFFRSCGDCPYTIPQDKPKQAIDYIAYKKGNRFQIINHEVIPERYASDHLPVLAVLKLNLD